MGQDWDALVALLKRARQQEGREFFAINQGGQLVSLPLDRLIAQANFTQVVMQKPS